MGFSFTTKASNPPPPNTVWNATGLVGKSVEAVKPVTYTLPVASTAIPRPASSPVVPPRYVEYVLAVKALLSFTTNASDPPCGVG